MLEKGICIVEVMGLGVGSDYGVPEVDTSLGRFVEQVMGRDEVAVDGVESDDSSGVKWVL